MNIKFQDDLPLGVGRKRQPIKWAEAKAEMIANDGKWGLIAENISSSTPHQIRTGKNKHFRGEELAHFEFAIRQPEDPSVKYGTRRADLWGRYRSNLNAAE